MNKADNIEKLKAAWKNRPSYLGDIKNSPLFNVYRSFRFTKKGMKVGCSDDWKNYKNFYNDMKDSYESGLRLGRIDKNRPFSKDNCTWMTDYELAQTKQTSVKLEYNGEVRTLSEWSWFLGIPISGLRQRYHKGKNYTSEQVLFGKYKLKKGEMKTYDSLSGQSKRNKVSKMVSAYRCKDKKKGMSCDITNQWFLDNIISKPCFYCGDHENVGCDRIDNSKGHTMDNVVPCCYICNTVRQDNFSVDEMVELGKTISYIKLKRSSNLKIA